MLHSSGAAAISKVRAMYGKRLSPKDWENLLACSTIKEAAAYLKNNTAYQDVLSKVSSETIHRHELERFLQERLVQESFKLSHYDVSGSWNASHFILANLEIDQILSAVIRVISHEDDHYFHEPNRYLDAMSRLDQRSLDKADTFAEILEAIEETPYYEILNPFSFESEKQEDYTRMERELQVYAYRRMYEYIDQNASKNAQKALRQLFDEMIDLTNYSRIFRMKKYFGTSNVEIRYRLFPFGNINKERMQEMIAAESEVQLTEIMKQTRTGKRVLKIEHQTIDELAATVRHQLCRRNILYSEESSVVMLSYIFLLQAELNGLIHVIEGVRYGMPKAEIRRLLQLYDFV
ncbi:V0D/AC39 family V-type ATPase subunit [Scatolibacter rhodanostii]|uniref:V0D/AC39 family V-type ATPase subunit n=1 Tax=Scatolibacter rhodanostii TaxID=2014781 RepID=UPI000C0757B6|nr:V-type ATPase subunit [Scatolibacter rhodanostii]